VTAWGADAGQLESLAAQFGRHADLLDYNRVRLNSQVHHAPWRGHEADRFRRNWDQMYVRHLVSAAAFLHAGRTALLQHAAEQRAASGLLTGAATGTGLAIVSIGALHRGPGKMSVNDTAWYHFLNSGVRSATGLIAPAAKAVGTPLPLLSIANEIFDIGKLFVHGRSGDTSSMLYDLVHVGLDITPVVTTAVVGVTAGIAAGVAVGTGVGVVIAGVAVLWKIAASDPAVMPDMHAAGKEYAKQHYRQAALDVGKGLAHFAWDLGQKAVSIQFPAIQQAWRFLHRKH
jgi:hypothetical protein